jgi:hypothetical protein
MIKFLNYEKEKDIRFMYVFFCLLNIPLPKNNSNNFVSWCLCG